ncbi:MAG: hypothetical protein V3U51_00085 [Thermoplasmata archaeon]
MAYVGGLLRFLSPILAFWFPSRESIRKKEISSGLFERCWYGFGAVALRELGMDFVVVGSAVVLIGTFIIIGLLAVPSHMVFRIAVLLWRKKKGEETPEESAVEEPEEPPSEEGTELE